MYDAENDEDLTEIRKLYPTLKDDELRTAKDNLKRYVEVICRVEERLKTEGKSFGDPT